MEFEGIHPTAIISSDCKIGNNVSIGPFTVIGSNVEIGDGCVIHNHVTIHGYTKMGVNNKIFSYCSIGAPPQDQTFKNEPTVVEIGDNNVFREYVSIHRGTMKEKGLTKIGNNILLMAYVHVGHDVIIGNNCVVANSVNFAGHVKIGERCIIGGGTNISQFVTLGRGSYIGGASAIDRDIPEFCTAVGNRVKLKGINIIGLRRQGHTKQVISEVVDFFRIMESSALSPRAFVSHDENLKDFSANEIIKEMATSIRESEIGMAPFSS